MFIFILFLWLIYLKLLLRGFLKEMFFILFMIIWLMLGVDE